MRRDSLLSHPGSCPADGVHLRSSPEIETYSSAMRWVRVLIVVAGFDIEVPLGQNRPTSNGHRGSGISQAFRWGF
jgi:hypothetical protein